MGPFMQTSQTVNNKSNMAIPPKKDFPQAYPQEDYTDYTKAENCLSQITDPLWQNICADLINMMGPASVLKIWESILGELSLQTEEMDITCKNEVIASFVQQYDFVILGSLQR